jgi:hypothetical protein
MDGDAVDIAIRLLDLSGVESELPTPSRSVKINRLNDARR